MPPVSIKYIESAFQKGYNEEQVRRSLRIQGISEAEINAAFEDFNKNKQSQPQAAQPSSESRMEFKPLSSQSNSGVILAVVVLLIVLGAAAAGYFYFGQIKSFATETWSKLMTVNNQEEFTPAPSLPAVSPVTIVPAEEEVTAPAVVPSADELKVSAIAQIQQFLAAYYGQNGKYPETISQINDVGGGFYCYRQNGAHYVLGAVLESDNIVLTNDLDGDYYCGAAVKKCADPVYCAAP